MILESDIKSQLENKYWENRAKVAEKPDLDEEIQLFLTSDKDMGVRNFLAMNSTITEKTQRVLAEDKLPEIRQMLAMNKSLQLKPAIVLYYDTDKRTKNLLEEYHPELYMEIKGIEKSMSRGTSFSFLHSKEQKRSNALNNNYQVALAK